MEMIQSDTTQNVKQFAGVREYAEMCRVSHKLIHKRLETSLPHLRFSTTLQTDKKVSWVTMSKGGVHGPRS
jgi:hypothetical protein